MSLFRKRITESLSDLFADDFLEWMSSPEARHSIDALDVVFAALEKTNVDAIRRKIVWEVGKRLSIPESAERVRVEYPDLPREAI